MTITKNIDIWMLRSGYPPRIECVQYDSGLEVVFNFKDFSVPTSAIARLYIEKPSGKFVYQSCTILSTTLVKTTVNSQAFAEFGTTYGQIRIDKSGVLSTFDIIFDVKKSRADAQAVASTNVVSAFDDLAREILSNLGIDNTLTKAGLAADAKAVGDKVKDLENLEEVKAEGNGKYGVDLEINIGGKVIKSGEGYQKPLTGIQLSDLSSDVQSKLLKADSAYHKPSTGIPSSDLSEDVRLALQKANTAVQTIPQFPTSLKNPSAITFTGAVSASYDGSAPVTVNIPTGGSATGTNARVYYAEDYGISTSSSDNANALQSLINTVRNNGGGTIVFGTGTFKISHIDLKIGVSLCGQGYPATKLLHVPRNKTTDLSMIRIPKYSAFNTIVDIELLGTSHQWLHENYAFWAKKNYGIDFLPSEYIGILVDDAINSDGVEYLYINKLATNASDIVEKDDSTGSKISYKYLNVLDTMIVGFTGFGMRVLNSYTVNIDGLHVHQCGCGINVLGTDHWIKNIWVERCVWEGAIISCSNSVVANGKIIWNDNGMSAGAYNTLVSPYLNDTSINPYKNDVKAEPVACVIFGSRMKVNQIEAQDNAFHGIYVGGQYTMADTILSDGNAWILGEGSGVSKGAKAVQIKGKGCQIGKVAVTNYNKGRQQICADYGIVVSYAPESRIEYVIEENITNHAYAYDNSTSAVINGVTI